MHIRHVITSFKCFAGPKIISPDRGRLGIWIWNHKKLYEHLLHEWLPCESRIRSVILHVGTNNASTLRDNTPIRQCAEEIFDVMELLNSIYPQAEIWFSGILPRLDDDHKRGLNINEVKLSESEIHEQSDRSRFWSGIGFAPWIPDQNHKMKILESQVNVSRNRLNLQIYWFIRIISKRRKIYRQIAFQAWFFLFFTVGCVFPMVVRILQ